MTDEPKDDQIVSYSGSLNATQRGMLGSYLTAAKRVMSDPAEAAENEQRAAKIKEVLAEIGVDPTGSQEVMLAVLFGTSTAVENLLYVTRQAGAPEAFLEGFGMAADLLLTAVLLGCGMEVGRIPTDRPLDDWLEERERIAHQARNLDDDGELE